MSEFKPFSGKNLDEAIAEAVKFLGVDRDKLEIEIIHGGSSGIFGLVGKRKAEIRARKRPAPKPKGLDQVLAKPAAEAETAETAEAAPAEEAKPRQQRQERAPRPPKAEAESRAPREPAPKPEPAARAEDEAEGATAEAAAPAEEAQAPREPRQGRSRGRGRGRGSSQQQASDQEGGEQQPKAQGRGQPREDRPRREPRPPREPREQREPREPRPERAPRPRREELSLSDNGEFADQPELEREDTTPASDELLAMTREIANGVLSRLLEQEVPLEVSGTASRLTVTVVEEEHSGLLIGREGATLQALQYIMTRMLAKKIDQPVKVSLNAGEYREKQDQNLKKTALFLAEKAKTSGRPQSTKPLSSYHRRVVHLALQEDPDIVTRSKGDSALKRVIILPKRKGNGAPAEQEQTVEE